MEKLTFKKGEQMKDCPVAKTHDTFSRCNNVNHNQFQRISMQKQQEF